MIYIIIRCYKGDEHHALVAYESMKRVGIEGSFIFHYDNELDEPEHINKTGETIINRQPCGNFGGLLFVRKMMDDLQLLPKFKDDDYIIYCDADIIMKDNPFKYLEVDKNKCFITEQAGVMGEALVAPGVVHVSGQLNIIKGKLWNLWIQGGQTAITTCHEYLIKHGLGAGCADDTLFSIFSRNVKQYAFKPNECWIHDKWTMEQYVRYINIR